MFYKNNILYLAGCVWGVKSDSTTELKGPRSELHMMITSRFAQTEVKGDEINRGSWEGGSEGGKEGKSKKIDKSKKQK